MTIAPNSGTGSGPITPDGSPVEFYAMQTSRGEPEIVAAVTPEGGSILELGCGTGRMTHPLVERGHEVVAVDESAEMLAHVRGARTVRARIGELRLERRFDTVLLASHLVQTSAVEARHELLEACARHVAPDGRVIVQWMPPEPHDAWRVGQGRTEDGITVKLASLEEREPGRYAATMRYTVGEREWTQSFTSWRLSDEDLARALEAAGLRLERFLTEDRMWVAARPAAFTA
ncbi:class I SAM-dependent methyltransferase [Nonomuraea sp. SMC257]|uniref:Class I SAM-dependent methyltransferase n=1 Tax=Nonomuraea montanisoli TaxID=2741721 RepID=A0A7Y6I8Q6_9ACTN|nr:class I SAM-dependent methyltransferase [Nonomuraea montanisoli]NUW32860.1 class I SAM-dependent methyltransferase [Nonomuraea montanisoli]